MKVETDIIGGIVDHHCLKLFFIIIISGVAVCLIRRSCETSDSHICGVMASVLASSAADHEFEPHLDQTRH